MDTDPRAARVTFLVLGCQRCGTTWIDAALREHPQVYLPPQKQTYFFDRNHDRGADWYLGQFDGVGPEHRAVGEVATGYCLPGAIERTAALLPHVKVIMAMRHPVERAYSNYRSRCVEEGWSTFAEALETSPDLVERGLYIDQVERVLAHYPRERFLPLIYDDLEADDRAYLARLLEFLGVEPAHDSSMIGQRKNAAGHARLRSALHRAGLKPALRLLSRSPIGAAIRRRTRRRAKQGAAAMDPAVRAAAIERFRAANDRLGAFLGRDLSRWNE